MCLKEMNTVHDLKTLKEQVSSTKIYVKVFGALFPDQFVVHNEEK